jgi:hypothetical protein
VHGGRRRRARAEEERWWGCGHGVGDGGFRVVEDPGTEAELAAFGRVVGGGPEAAGDGGVLAEEDGGRCGRSCGGVSQRLHLRTAARHGDGGRALEGGSDRRLLAWRRRPARCVRSRAGESNRARASGW